MNRAVIALVCSFSLLVSTPRAFAQAELVAAVAAQAGISTADADAVLGAFANAVSKGGKKGDRVSLVGFGSFSVAKRPLDGSAVVPPIVATGKALKVAFRDGSKTAGTLTPTKSYWNVALGLGDRTFADDPIELEVSLPKPFTTKILELEIGLPSTAPGTTFRALLDGLTADEGLVLEINFPRDAFDDVVYDELNPGPDFLAAFYPAFHPGASSDPSTAALLSERIGFAGVPLCADGAGCVLPPTDLDALKTAIATAASVPFDTASHGVDAILALPASPPGVTSTSGFGTFAAAKREARPGRNPQTGKAIKIAAKKVVKFKAGAELAH